MSPARTPLAGHVAIVTGASRGIGAAPGPILTEHLERAGTTAQQRAAATLPTRRLGQPEEVAAAAVWLCGPESAFITGTTLPIDGGLLAGMAPFADPRERTST